MDELELLVALHGGADRQGPGSTAATSRALELSGLMDRRGLRIADIGCGTGASSLVLARVLDARIEAVDMIPQFLATLRERADAAGLAGRIHTHEQAMESLDFKPRSLDAIWSEGAIYNMGFAAGCAAWRELLKDGGVLAVSELTWLTGQRPQALEAHWYSQYPQVDTAAAKLRVLEDSGFSPLGYFVLPVSCWLDNYYTPLRERFEAFLEGQGHSDLARSLVAAEEAEIALYERYADYFGYGFYIARRVSG